MISTRELHSIIKPLQSNSSTSSATKSQPAVTTSSDSPVKLEDDKLTSPIVTATPTTDFAPSGDKTSTVQASTQPEFNVPTVVYDKPCKKPKSILKGGNKIDQLDDVSLPAEDSPTALSSAKVPRKIGLEEYKKRHKERRDSEEVVEDGSNNNSFVEVAAKTTSKDCKTSVDSSSSSPTHQLMIIEGDAGSSLDGAATSKASSDVSVSFKEEKKGDSPSKHESLSPNLSKGQSIGKPVKIPHPMSVLASSSSAIVSHKYTPNLPELSMPQYYPGGSQYPTPAYRHDWTTNYPLFGGLSRPYLIPHPPTAPLPSAMLTTPMIPSLPPPPVVLPSSTQKADEEMARVEDLTEMFTKNLQNKLKHVIESDDSSRESSPKPRKSRSLSRSQSPPPRLSRRGRSPRRSRKSNSRSQSLDSCRGSDREQVRSRSKSPRSHKSHRSRRHRSSSRDSSVEDRRHSRSLKRSRNDKRRDHKPISTPKTIGTQTEENTYKSGDTKRLSEKEVQTDRLLFVHSKASQTYPMFENHKAVQVDFPVCSHFYADFAQYLETYPIDMFNFNEILSTSITYFEQEISKAFPCNRTLTSKQLNRILGFNHMKKLRSKLSTLLKESQGINPYNMADDAYRPGTPLLDDNQPVVNLTSVVSGGDHGNEQLNDDDSSGLSNSDILSDSEASNDSVNLNDLLSQYSNSSKPTQEEHAVSTETSHAMPTKNHPEEAAPSKANPEKVPYKQPTKPDDNASNIKGLNKVTGQLAVDDTNATENTIIIKEEDTDEEKSFIPENYKLVDSPPLSSAHYSSASLQNDHTYSKAGGNPSGAQFKALLDPLESTMDRTLLTVVRQRKTNSCGTKQKSGSPKVPLGEEIYQSIKKGCEEFLSSAVYSPTRDNDHHPAEELIPNAERLSVGSENDTIDMEISVSDMQSEEDTVGTTGTEEKATDEMKPQPSKSSQASTEDKKGSVIEVKTKGGARKGGNQKDMIHHYTYHTAVPLHYQAQPFKYRQQRPQIMYYGPAQPNVYPWDWRRSYGWGPPRY